MLVYTRLTPEQLNKWRVAPGITVLADAQYVGAGTPDVVYAALFADAEAVALYDAVYDRSPRQIPDEEGAAVTFSPPERFGQMG